MKIGSVVTVKCEPIRGVKGEVVSVSKISGSLNVRLLESKGEGWKQNDLVNVMPYDVVVDPSYGPTTTDYAKIRIQQIDLELEKLQAEKAELKSRL